MVLDWLLGMLLPDVDAPGLAGFVLFAVQLVVLIVQMVLVGRARRYRLESERWSMRADEAARRADESASRMATAIRAGIKEDGS